MEKAGNLFRIWWQMSHWSSQAKIKQTEQLELTPWLFWVGSGSVDNLSTAVAQGNIEWNQNSLFLKVCMKHCKHKPQTSVTTKWSNVANSEHKLWTNVNYTENMVATHDKPQVNWGTQSCAWFKYSNVIFKGNREPQINTCQYFRCLL